MEGRPINYYCTDKFDKTFKLKIADLAINSMLKMVFNDNFTHGDLHPGL